MNRLFSKDNQYFAILLAHILLGCILYKYPKLGSYFGILVAVSGFFYVIFHKNKNHEVLQVAGYFIGSEVLLRMTYGFLSYEFMKCSLLMLAGLGIFYDGFSKKTLPYWIYLLALIPSIFFENDLSNITRTTLNGIAFDLLGPVCLGFFAIYTYGKKISLQTLNTILMAIGLPILSCGAYVFLYNPDIDIYLRGVCSNSMFSGGFGPNQVSTILGLGMFIFFMQLVINSATKIRFGVHLSIFSLLCYLGFLTFSRGGMITGCAICIIFLISIYYGSESYGKAKAKTGLVYFTSVVLLVIGLISYQTNGLIEKRYTNRDHRGKVQKDTSVDRKALAQTQIRLFIENPVLGVGLGKGITVKEVKSGHVNSHDELTRLLANHGIMGLLNILILIITPMVLFFKSRHNAYCVVFFTFWFLSINHSGMRTAAPAFLYALTLLCVKIDDEIFFKKPNESTS
ncbi:O-antigen ligase family protein [Flavobacterium sp.]|uniref:O-antigen ligase family protein n=1 Tax=Flavobacterium sp. TaxID=239 RepID=UPI0026151CEA|nr:O-antigen ligase family protein [Flavobacterium sp.]